MKENLNSFTDIVDRELSLSKIKATHCLLFLLILQLSVLVKYSTATSNILIDGTNDIKSINPGSQCNAYVAELAELDIVSLNRNGQNFTLQCAGDMNPIGGFTYFIFIIGSDDVFYCAMSHGVDVILIRGAYFTPDEKSQYYFPERGEYYTSTGWNSTYNWETLIKVGEVSGTNLTVSIPFGVLDVTGAKEWFAVTLGTATVPGFVEHNFAFDQVPDNANIDRVMLNPCSAYAPFIPGFNLLPFFLIISCSIIILVRKRVKESAADKRIRDLARISLKGRMTCSFVSIILKN